MDETDLRLIRRLAVNSRAPYRELAEPLGLSVDAVHKRIQGLVASGILPRFSANVRFDVLGGVGVTIFGHSDVPDLTSSIRKVGESELVYAVHVTGGRLLYVLGVLRDISELGDLTALVRDELHMQEPTVGISDPSSERRKRDLSLSTLDYRIIHALHDDARRPVTEVAKQLGVSAKTVRRRLSKLEEDRVVGYGIEFVPTAGHDIISYMHMTLKDGVNATTALATLLNTYSPQVLGGIVMSNLPNFLFCSVWSGTMRELKDLQGKLEGEGLFTRIVPNIFYDAYIFETWRDALLRERARGGGA